MYTGTVGAIIISRNAIEKAAKIIGSETALAKKIGVSKQRLNYWKNALMPYDMAIAIYLITEGKVDIDELRPDKRFLTKKFKAVIAREHQ